MILIILKRLGNMPYLSICLKTLLIISFLLSTSIFFLLKVNYAHHLRFNGETVLIERTQFGIPHVKAQSFSAAAYGWGYVTAQDRLFQLAFKRLIGKGRISKYLGKKALNVDKFFRQLNFGYWADRTAEKMKRQNITEYRNFENYVQGINDHVKSLTFLPIEFQLIGLDWQPWTVSDIFLQTKLLVWSQSQNMGEEFIRSQLLKDMTENEVINRLPYGKLWQSLELIPIVTDEEIADMLPKWTYNLTETQFTPQKIQKLTELGIMDYLDQERGSNSWVIHGNLTQSGLPLIANDPHLESAIPHQWHQIKIQYVHQGRTVFWQGPAMTGTLSIVGRTPYFALALTTIHSDSQDLYKEKINGDYYEVDGQQLKLRKRVEVIEIQDEEPLYHIVQETHRGPILSCVTFSGTMYQVNETDKISLAWTGFHDKYETWMANSHSAQVNNFQDLKNYLLNYTDNGPNMNALIATKDNHIGYVAIGALPKRKNHYSGLFIKDGTTFDHDWKGLIYGEQQLHLFDPPKGYIVTANNRPVSQKYQHGAYESSMLTARANRINDMIQQKIKIKEKFTVEHMKRIQLDTVDVMCRQNIPHIIQGVPEATKYLQNFNCDFTRQSFGATINEVFFYQLYKLIFPSNQYNLMSSPSYQSYLFKYIRNFTQPEVKANMNKAFENTIKNLTEFFGTDHKESWVWQKYHPDVIIHRPFSGSQVLRPFYQKRFPGKGNYNTVNVAKMNKLSNGDFSTNHRANIRTIWSWGKNDKSYWIADTGINQKFYSRHYDDQFKLFTKDEYLQVNFQNNFHEENQQI